MFLMAVCALVRLPGTVQRVSMGIGLDSRTEAQLDTSKVTSSSTCTPSRRPFATTTKRDNVFCHDVAEVPVRHPAILG